MTKQNINEEIIRGYCIVAVSLVLGAIGLRLLIDAAHPEADTVPLPVLIAMICMAACLLAFSIYHLRCLYSLLKIIRKEEG